MSATDIPQSHRDLLNAPFATLATIGPTGRPQMSAVCFLASDDGKVQLSLNETRQKTKNMVATPKVSLQILDPGEPYRYLELRGDASVEPDDDYVFGDLLGAKYGGMDVRRMDRPGERRTKVTVTLTRARAVDMREPGAVGAALDA